MKRFFEILLLIFLFVSVGFLDDCPDICVNKPYYIQVVDQLSKNIFSITRIKKTQQEGYGKGILSDIKYLIEQASNKSGNVVGCFGFYGNTLFSNSMNIIFGIFTLLKSSWAVVRDYSKLRDLADLVRNVYFTICTDGNIETELNKDQQYQLKKAISYYNSENPLIFVSLKNINNGLKYQDVYEFLYYLINLHKDGLLKIMKAKDVNDIVSFLSGNYINNCNSGKPHDFCHYFNIKLNKDLISKLMVEYNQCSTCKVNFWDKVKKMVNGFKSNIGNDWDRIQRAYERLKETLLGLGGGLTKYEARKAFEYWGKQFKKGTGSVNPFIYKRLEESIDKDLKEQWNEFITPFSGMKAIGRAFWLQSFGVKKIDSGYNNFEAPTQKMLKDEFVRTISKTLDLMLKQAESLKDKEIKSDPTYITRLMPGITYRIKQAMYILGKKDIEGSIVWYLGKSCEMQCSNVGCICWYY